MVGVGGLWVVGFCFVLACAVSLPLQG
jgi:hypothetical protein